MPLPLRNCERPFGTDMPRTARRLYLRLALQNLGRRRIRTVLLILAVGLGFGALTLLGGIERSMTAGFHRLGADLLVVPETTMVNLTAALLTVQPTAETLDGRLAQELAQIPGVARVAPQTLIRVSNAGGEHGGSIDVIAFDPLRDFTVLPWLAYAPARGLRRGEVLLGGHREERIGEKIPICGAEMTAYAQLESTGVGPFDGGLLVTYETAADLALACRGRMGEGFAYDPSRVSALLILLTDGTTPERVRFAIAQRPGLKVVSGSSLVTTIRQGASSLLGGVLVLALVFLLIAVMLVGLLYSAIVAERSREIGLLMALGSRGRNVVQMVLAAASVTTAMGGLLGVVGGVGLLLAFRRSVGYAFEMGRVRFIWPPPTTIAAIAAGCVLLSAGIGLLGAAVPAWRASRREPYGLIRGEVE
jgi:putative ABC transport system permease protein